MLAAGIYAAGHGGPGAGIGDPVHQSQAAATDQLPCTTAPPPAPTWRGQDHQPRQARQQSRGMAPSATTQPERAVGHSQLPAHDPVAVMGIPETRPGSGNPFVPAMLVPWWFQMGHPCHLYWSRNWRWRDSIFFMLAFIQSIGAAHQATQA